jgi:hypothetical protein
MNENDALPMPLKNGPESTNLGRRSLLSGLAALLASSPLAKAENAEVPNDPFILLLTGIYQAVAAGAGPATNLGLTKVNLNDGSYSATKIYPVFGIDGKDEDDKRPIGTFYVQFNGDFCAYDLPGGSLAMAFTAGGFTPHADGRGGLFLEGTFELTIIEATGVYSKFQGGHNHMVDRLHQLSTGQFDEFCFCNISTYPFP